MITAFIEGIPKAQPRVKATGRGNFIRMYTPGTAKEWKGLITSKFRTFEKIGSAPVEIGITFLIPRPKSHYGSRNKQPYLRSDAPKYHAQKPDKDNLEKAVYDAISASGFWTDDCQVVAGGSTKTWAKDKTGAIITITLMV
jgi:Holliday junction resolvase RusA-like endonuclease